MIGTWRLRHSVQSIILPRIMPGTYTFSLCTGRRLLSMELTDEDLIWSWAFPDQDLPVAADSGKIGLTPSQIIRLWDGKLVSTGYFQALKRGRIDNQDRRSMLTTSPKTNLFTGRAKAALVFEGDTGPTAFITPIVARLIY